MAIRSLCEGNKQPLGDENQAPHGILRTKSLVNSPYPWRLPRGRHATFMEASHVAANDERLTIGTMEGYDFHRLTGEGGHFCASRSIERGTRPANRN
jgi:hypothetical protein